MPTIFHEQAMDTFLTIHQKDIVGTLSMFDRMIFKGYLSGFFPKGAFGGYLSRQGILLKDFSRFVQERTKTLKAHSEGLVCIFFGSETCMSFDVQGNRQTHKLEVVRRQRRCLHYYLYYLDAEFG